MIVDSHMHIFPPLQTAPGWSDPLMHRQMLQLYISGHHQPVRRLSDHARVPEAESRDLSGSGVEPLPDVDFRAGAFGRFEWTIDSVDYYRQFLPPGLQTMESPPEYVLQEMANAGIDRAVLQNARIYGKLEEQFAAAVRDYPGKFIGLAGVDEPNAHTEAERFALRRSITELGLRGIYYANRGFYRVGYARSFDDPLYDGYWSDVAALRAVVFWELAGVPRASSESYLRELDRLNRWTKRFPSIRSILTHGIPMALLTGNVPEPVAALLRNESIWTEVLYPIGIGGTFDYPFVEARPVIRELYRRAGGGRLVWGSDMPNVARHCTYRQSLDYLAKYCAFLPSSDLDRIVGGNLEGLFA